MTSRLYERALFIDRINNASQEDGRILSLQQDLETGKITRQDISERDYNQVIELYQKQINELQTTISMKENQLQGYKNRILDIRKRLEVNSV